MGKQRFDEALQAVIQFLYLSSDPTLAQTSVKYMYIYITLPITLYFSTNSLKTFLGTVYKSSMSKKKTKSLTNFVRPQPPPKKKLDKHWNFFGRYILCETYMTLVGIHV